VPGPGFTGLGPSRFGTGRRAASDTPLLSAESEKKALAAGADTFVSKADTPERLLAAIDYFLNPNPKSSTSQ